jgi:Flp pilus assembly protein TadD
MSRTRCCIATLIGFWMAVEAQAQFIGPPIIGVPVVTQGGIDFRVGGRQLRIRGFIPIGPPYTVIVPATPTAFGYRQVGPALLPYGPYSYPFPTWGAIDQRLTVQVITPVVTVRPPLSLAQGPERYDLSGIDLDVEPASKIWGEKPGLAKAKLPPPKNAEVARPAPPPEPKKPDVVANPPPPPAPRPPKVNLTANQFLDQGVAAFRDGEFGVALLRFRQADETVPPAPRALFFQTHAYIAVGKYQEAAETLRKALEGQPNAFPAMAFAPKKELYDGDENAWANHRKRLEQAHELDAKNADCLYLLGYLAWFDGQRDAAVGYFQQARALVADPRWCDLFLNVVK